MRKEVFSSISVVWQCNTSPIREFTIGLS